MRILLVEDTAELARSVGDYLRGQGHAVDIAVTLTEAADTWAVGDYACVILDLGLPDGSGLELLRARRRAKDRTPVIIATAFDQITDRIAGLDAGADDYVTKPFDMGELAARLRAHTRRSEGQPNADIEIGPWHINRAAARVQQDGAEIRLTSREWSVLDALLAARGRVLSKAALEEALYAFDDAIEGNAVEVYISRLRSKLGAGLIRTKRGLGYLIE
ncbi:response regulator transcription factor [Falsirhodobacter sp. alg1]|uniref:response regulator transcription factor n=1 Tax=Falsirhodobacter sp. alg1 TaxID=1472418 RepID=UPI000788EBD2|nr:response regulator transcription factor [Falsirhodobacter sp. alg1]